MTVVPVLNWKNSSIPTAWFDFDPAFSWRDQRRVKCVHAFSSRPIAFGLRYGSWSDSVTQLWAHSALIWKQSHQTQSDFWFWNGPCNWTPVLPAIVHMQSCQAGHPLGGLQQCLWVIGNQLIDSIWQLMASDSTPAPLSCVVLLPKRPSRKKTPAVHSELSLQIGLTVDPGTVL